jgi:hypothetical protein
MLQQHLIQKNFGYKDIKKANLTQLVILKF